MPAIVRVLLGVAVALLLAAWYAGERDDAL